jgi:hypothetical protein
MPAWLIALIAQLPNIIAEIQAILQAIGSGTASEDQLAKLAAYSAAVDGINGVVSYHANAEV